MSSQDCRFFMEQGNEQCELFQRAHIFVRFKNSSHPINWINLYANDTKHRRYASWTLEQHEGDLAVHNVLEPQSLALGMIWKMMNHGETIKTWLVLSCNWSKTSVRSDVLAQSEALAPESVLLTDVLAPPGINHQPQTTNHQVTKSTSKCRASRATSCSPGLFRKDKALATSKWSVSQSASANIVLGHKKTSYSICSLAID